MAGQLGAGGFEPRTNPAERRDFFDLRRQITEINASLAALDTRVATLETLTDPSAWTAVSFQNSWANTAGQQGCEYRKVGDIVYLRGYIDSGTNNTTAFTLPVGFRPPANLDIPASAWTGAAHVVGNLYVQTNGGVIADRTTGSSMSFSTQFSVTA